MYSPYKNTGQAVGPSKLNMGVATNLYAPHHDIPAPAYVPAKDQNLRFQTNFDTAETYEWNLRSMIAKSKKNSNKEAYTLTNVINSSSDFQKMMASSSAISDEVLKMMEKQKGTIQEHRVFALPLPTEFIMYEIYGTLVEQKVANKFGGKEVVDVFKSPKDVCDSLLSAYGEVNFAMAKYFAENPNESAAGYSDWTTKKLTSKIHDLMTKKRDMIYITNIDEKIRPVVEDTLVKTEGFKTPLWMGARAYKKHYRMEHYDETDSPKTTSASTVSGGSSVSGAGAVIGLICITLIILAGIGFSIYGHAVGWLRPRRLGPPSFYYRR